MWVGEIKKYHLSLNSPLNQVSCTRHNTTLAWNNLTKRSTTGTHTKSASVYVKQNKRKRQARPEGSTVDSMWQKGGLLRQLCAPEKPIDKTCKGLCELLWCRCRPTPLEIVQRSSYCKRDCSLTGWMNSWLYFRNWQLNATLEINLIAIYEISWCMG